MSAFEGDRSGSLRILLVSVIAVAVAGWLAAGGYDKVTGMFGSDRTFTPGTSCPAGYTAVVANADPLQGRVYTCVPG